MSTRFISTSALSDGVRERRLTTRRRAVQITIRTRALRRCIGQRVPLWQSGSPSRGVQLGRVSMNICRLALFSLLSLFFIVSDRDNELFKATGSRLVFGDARLRRAAFFARTCSGGSRSTTFRELYAGTLFQVREVRGLERSAVLAQLTERFELCNASLAPWMRSRGRPAVAFCAEKFSFPDLSSRPLRPRVSAPRAERSSLRQLPR